MGEGEAGLRGRWRETRAHTYWEVTGQALSVNDLVLFEEHTDDKPIHLCQGLLSSGGVSSGLSALVLCAPQTHPPWQGLNHLLLDVLSVEIRELTVLVIGGVQAAHSAPSHHLSHNKSTKGVGLGRAGSDWPHLPRTGCP